MLKKRSTAVIGAFNGLCNRGPMLSRNASVSEGNDNPLHGVASGIAVRLEELQYDT